MNQYRTTLTVHPSPTLVPDEPTLGPTRRIDRPTDPFQFQLIAETPNEENRHFISTIILVGGVS